MKNYNSNDISAISDKIHDIEAKDIINNLASSEGMDSFKVFEECSFLKVVQLNYEDEYPMTQAMENTLTVMNEFSCNFVYLINSNEKGVNLFIGISENNDSKYQELIIEDYTQILKNSIEGNFQGSILEDVLYDTYIDEIVTPIEKSKYFSMITGIPSKENHEDEKNKFQSIDRLLHSMQGEEFTILLVSKPWSQLKVDQLRDNIYEIYNQLHAYEKISMQISDDSTDVSSKRKSKDKIVNVGKNKISQKGGDSNKETQSAGDVTKTTTDESTTETSNKSRKNIANREYIEKEVYSLLKYIDDILMKRVHIGYRKGFFETATYFSAKSNSVLINVEKTFISLFQGESESLNPLNIKRYAKKVTKAMQKKAMLNFDLYYEKNLNSIDPLLANLCSVPCYNSMRGLSALLTSEEVSLISGFPRKEVVGIQLNQGVEFGLNISNVNYKEKLTIGKIMHKGSILSADASIDKTSLDKHVFIAGVTGTGKTTTCQNLLIECGFPFLVIEPAKTEYRELIRSKAFTDDVYIFTLGNEKIAPFRINPFEFLPTETITAHVDMLKASFEAAFDMEAAMPQILEAAIYRCYEMYGWDINDDSNEFLDDRLKAFDGSGLYFPILSDLIKVVHDVVDEQGFDDRLKNDYIGSLVARINGLIVGSKGQMLNCKKSMDFDWLLDHNVVLELEELKSGSDKALLIGFILSRLRETIKARHTLDYNFKHITLIEEAHRLLTNTALTGNSSKTQSVEMFTDMLAEVRKYGESLIIVDQIPNKLAPDVLKNTNTKIIHKLFAQDDKDSVGNTMALTDEQKRHLSYLKIGETIVFSQGWQKPVQVKINKLSDTSDREVPIELVRNIYFKYLDASMKQHEYLYSKLENQYTYDQLKDYEIYRSNILSLLRKEFVVHPYEFDESRIKKFRKLLDRQLTMFKFAWNIDIMIKLLAYELFFMKNFMLNSEAEMLFVSVYEEYFKLIIEAEYEKIEDYILEYFGYF